MEMKMYMGADEGDDEHIDERSPGGIVIETLSNIRTVASLTLEEKRAAEYLQALVDEDPRPIRTNVVKGMERSPSAVVCVLRCVVFVERYAWLQVLSDSHIL
jgi:hypothetical protein